MELQDLLAAQGGVLTYDQARHAGVSARQLRPGGAFVRLRQGVYAPTASRSPAQAAALHVAAVRLTTGVDLVAAGATAAQVHGLPVLGTRRLHLVERKELRPLHHGRSAGLEEDEVVRLHGVPVTARARTTVDVARRGGFAAGLVTADAALRAGLAAEQLRLAADSARRWPGVRHARRAADAADPLAESALESLGRARVLENGLPCPELQVVLGDEHGPIGRVDQYWSAHRTVAEADGALKYAAPGDLFAEKRREDRLREAGFEVARYTWEEALRTPDVLVTRLLRAFTRADRRAA